MKQQRQKVWKFINYMLKDMSTKTLNEHCVSWQFSFFLGAGNLLNFFFLIIAKNKQCESSAVWVNGWKLQYITDGALFE